MRRATNRHVGRRFRRERVAFGNSLVNPLAHFRNAFPFAQDDASAMEKGPKEIKYQTQHPPGITRRAWKGRPWKGSSTEPKPNRHTDAFDVLRSLRARLVVMRETRIVGVELDVVRLDEPPHIHWAVLSVRTSGASGAVCNVHEMSAY